MNQEYKNKIDFLLECAKERNSKGDRLGVVKYLTEIITLDPDNKLMYHLRGNEYYNLKEYDKSINDFEKALKIDPNNDNFYLCLGAAKRQNGDIKSAFSDYKKGLEINSYNFDLWFNIAHIRRLGDDYQGAKKCFENVLKLKPNDIESKEWVKKCSLFNNTTPLEDYITNHPFNCDELITIGLDFENKGNLPEAYSYYKRAEELYPEITIHKKHLLRIKEKLGI